MDFLRGLAVILMMVDHFMVDMVDFYNFFEYSSVPNGFIDALYGLANWYWRSWFGEIEHFLHMVFVALFLLLVGISCNFSRSNGKRAAEVGLIAGIFTAFSALTSESFGPPLIEGFTLFDSAIVSGILHIIFFSILIEMTARGIFDNKYFILLLGGLIILWGILIDWDNVAYVQDSALQFPEFFKVFPSILLGYKGAGPDHFGLLPCAGMVLVGSYIGQVFYRERKSLLPCLDRGWNRPFCFIGRHALVFYVGHQIVLLPLLILTGIICGFTPRIF